MKQKPVKIKRYRKSFTSDNRKGKTALKWLCFVVALAVLFVLGFFFAKPVLDAVSGFWYSVVNPKDKDVSSSIETQSQISSVISEEISSSQADVINDPSQNGIWRVVSLSSVSSIEAAQNMAKTLASEGATHVLITLKDSTGSVYYNSAVQRAAAAITETTVDAKELADIFIAQGIQPCAYINAYEDSKAAYADRNIAVKYLNDSTIWLDTSLELGGKPWLNPYNIDAKNYITDLTAEIIDMGFTNVVIDKLQFPTGYGTNLCYYGTNANEKTKSQVLADTIADLQAIGQTKNANIWFEMPANVVLGLQADTFGEQPLGMGIDNLIINVNLQRLEDGTIYTGGVGEAELAQLITTAKQNGTNCFGIFVSDAALSDTDATALYNAALANGYNQKIYS